LIHETVDLVQRIIDPRITIQCRLDPDLWPAYADACQLSEVFLNLCLNARDAMPDGGRLTIETRNAVLGAEYFRTHADAVPGEFICLRFTDTGHGIPPEIREHIFEPFFTTKEPGKGTGLGLAMVFGILRQHRGWIECSQDVTDGACFEVFLPRHAQATAAPEAAAEMLALKGKGETILLADDEPMVRDFGERVLRTYGYHVIVAEDGKQALEIFRRQKDEIALVILDMTMPRLSGQETLEKLVETDPDVRAILVSGYFTEDALPTADRHVLGTLGKPYRMEELASTVRAALDAKQDSGDRPV
jgi:CheY-like chemotaxis protein